MTKNSTLDVDFYVLKVFRVSDSKVLNISSNITYKTYMSKKKKTFTVFFGQKQRPH